MTIPGKGGAPTGPKVYFSKVKEAREALKERANELIDTQFRIINEAILGKNFEVAAKANQFLLEHLASDDEGVRVLDVSIDKVVKSDGPSGPMIQIGLSLGGMTQPAALPPLPVITVEPEALPADIDLTPVAPTSEDLDEPSPEPDSSL